MFTINVGLYKECEFARSKHHQKFKIKICTWERTKILKSVLSGRIWDLIVSVPDHCLSFYLTEVLFVLDGKKTYFLLKSVYCLPQQLSNKGRPTRQIAAYVMWRYEVVYQTQVEATKRKLMVYNIRIFNDCEVRIENSVTRVTVRHHEACRVMPNSYPE